MAVKIYFPETGGYDIGRNPAFDSDSDPHLNVTVIHTTSEGTFAALKFATDLTAHLGARIRLVALQLVPFRLPIEEPMVSTSFLRQRQLALVSKLGLSEGEVDIQICLCRNERRALLEFLPARSLVILGGVRRWWRRNADWKSGFWTSATMSYLPLSDLRTLSFLTTYELCSDPVSCTKPSARPVLQPFAIFPAITAASRRAHCTCIPSRCLCYCLWIIYFIWCPVRSVER